MARLMSRAADIVAALLEAEPDPDEDIDPAKYIQQVDPYAVTYQKAVAMDDRGFGYKYTQFWHRTAKYAKGDQCQVRRNGATKIWKRQPGKFQIPYKYGLYNYGYITDKNAHEWCTTV